MNKQYRVIQIEILSLVLIEHFYKRLVIRNFVQRQYLYNYTFNIVYNCL